MKKLFSWGLHAKPGPKFNVFLALLPFIILIASYVIVSDMRLSDNPRDKIMPSISKMIESTSDYIVRENKQNCIQYEKVNDVQECVEYKKEYILFNDVIASLYRLIVGVGLASIVGLFLGVYMALFPIFRATANPITTFLSIVPPLALMPILLITAGTGDIAKIALIFIGVVFTITRDVYRATSEIPKEQITKALTLGAKEWEIVYKIVFPQVIPSLLDTIRLSLGSAWLFLIAGEAVASQDGLGYRIFLVRRYMAMDVIIPYVLVITLLGFLLDYLLRLVVKYGYPWYIAQRGGK